VRKMYNSKKRITLIVGIILWLAVLLLLNPLFLRLTNRELQKSEIEHVQSMGSNVIFNIDRVDASENLFKDVEIAGWAFIEHDGKDPDKKISLIFSSGKESYVIPGELITRPDVYEAKTLQNYIVPNNLNGFSGTFSPFAMRNGTYRMYLFVKENEELTGIVDTNRVYTVNFGNFTKLK